MVSKIAALLTKKSTVAGAVPSAALLQPAELAINLPDKKLYSKDSGGSIFQVAPAMSQALVGGVMPGVFDGVTDNTAVLTAFIARINTGAVKTVIVPEGVCITAPLPTITANDVNFIWLGELKAKANSLTAGKMLISVLGAQSQHLGTIRLNGNKQNHTTQFGCYLLYVEGVGHKFYGGINTHDSPYVGVAFHNVSDFLINGLTSEYNDNLGCEFHTCHHGQILGGSVQNNGFGFGKTRSSPADSNHLFSAFGSAMRYRCHDIEIVGVHFDNNGRDGCNVNQGAYNIKHLACTANNNDDGGFTIANDLVTIGGVPISEGGIAVSEPGNGEVCYNISYIDCDAENNYTGGIVAYGPVHGLVIRGGNNRNNHRLAGSLAQQTSYYNGVYIAPGSNGVNIDTNCYDDRQTRTITAVGTVTGGAVALTAPGWAAGLMLKYPKVGIYNANRAFMGWGQIIGEATGQLTIKSMPYNGVALSSISAGFQASQAVQLNGCFFDNGVAGIVKVRGNKPLIGPLPGLQGRTVLFANVTAGGAAVLAEGIPGRNCLLNGDFDVDISNWTFGLPGSGVAARDTGVTKSIASLRLTGGSGPALGDAGLYPGTLNLIRGTCWRFRGWMYSTVPAGARAQVYTSISPDIIAQFISDGSGWQPFQLSGGYDNGGTQLVVRLYAEAGQTARFDELYFEPYDDSPSSGTKSREYAA